MKQTLLLLIFACIANLSSIGQTTADFESFNLPQDTFLNGSDGNMAFESGNIILPNSYNDTYGSWTGWAISTMTDTTTPGFTNQYSCISGSGNNGSAGYATTFVSGESLIATRNEGQGGVVEGFYINNATYTYLSMRDGDAFAKKFGGEDGTDPDYLYVSIKEHGSRNVSNDSLIFYLADYRSDDPNEDYLVRDWTYIDLGRFENVDTLSLKLYSSDTGAFGVNTPAYFCIDDFTTTDMKLTAVTETTSTKISAYPNPAINFINIEAETDFSHLSLIDISGALLVRKEVNASSYQLDIAALPQGQYLLILEQKGRKLENILVTKL